MRRVSRKQQLEPCGSAVVKSRQRAEAPSACHGHHATRRSPSICLSRHPVPTRAVGQSSNMNDDITDEQGAVTLGFRGSAHHEALFDGGSLGEQKKWFKAKSTPFARS